MHQTKEQIESASTAPDSAWGYTTNPDDQMRKDIIIAVCKRFAPNAKRVLDVGAHEGWITKDLPAQEIFGYEIDDNAASRFPANVKRVHGTDLKEPYDLVVASGVCYGHYDFERIMDVIQNYSSDIIVISGIPTWFVTRINRLGKPIFTMDFPYRQEDNLSQRILVWRKTQS